MKKVLFTMICAAIFGGVANAKTTIYQCAVDQVEPHGARVNVVENKGLLRANLIFGTTVSGTIYNVEKTNRGYAGQIKNKPEFTMELVITNERDENSNIDGYKSHLKAVYPTLLNSDGYEVVETTLVCGEKISDRWN